MSEMIPSNRFSAARRTSLPMTRRAGRALTEVGERTTLRMAAAQAEGLVQAGKVQEVGRVTREAISDYRMLRRWAEVLAADPVDADELRFFTDVARLGMGELIADTIDTLRSL